MANAGTTPPLIDAELQAEALQRFNPFVFTFSVQTEKNICLPRIVEAMMRDPAFAEGFYVLGRTNSVTMSPPPRGKQTEKRSKALENVKSIATLLYEDYVQIAVGLEVRRREAERAREAEYAALVALYVEDGLSEAEAAKAAERELEGGAFEGGSSEGENTRKRLFVYLPTYPTNLEEVVELNNTGISLHAVISLSSRAILSGSVAATKPPQMSETTKTKERKETKRPVQKVRSAQFEERTRLSLVAELQQCLEREKSPAPYLKSICIHSYDVPTEEIPTATATNTTTATVAANMSSNKIVDSAAAAEAAIPAPTVVYRLKGTEGAVFGAIVDAILMLEEWYVEYCEWRQTRVAVDVPSYRPFRYLPTNEAGSPMVEERGRRRSLTKKKGNVPTPVVPAANVDPLPVFDSEPKHMKDVVAHRSVYDAILAEKRIEYFNKHIFSVACALQVASTLSMPTPELLDPLLPPLKRERQQMLRDKEESIAFVNYVLDVAMQGVDLAYQNSLLNFEKTVALKHVDADAFLSKKAGLEEEILSEASKANIVSLQKNNSCGSDTVANIKETAVSLMNHSFDINVDVARKMVLEMTALGVIDLGSQEEVAHARWINKSDSWRSATAKVGSCELEVLYRGTGSSRTESSVYAFCGSVSFAEYVDWQKHYVSEGLYYYPPPLDSDEEEPSEEEEEEEEEQEDEEGENTFGDGNPKEVKKGQRKKIEDPPPIDVVKVADAALRRRRTYEDIQRRLRQGKEVVQELMVSGVGAHCIAQEIQWMFADDGCTIEVRRIVGNTSQVHCSVTDPGGLTFGFLTMEEPPTEGISSVISSGLRCFLNIGESARFFFETVADNTDAVERAAYNEAVQAAKLEAKAQFDALEQTKTSKSSKEKVPPPTLAALEEVLLSRLTVPIERERKPPLTTVRAVFQDGSTVTFDITEKWLHFAVASGVLHSTLLDFVVDVWMENSLRSIRIYHIEAITVYGDGCVVVHAPEIKDYRVLFDMIGNYMTMNAEGTIVSVATSGKRSVVKADGQVVSLEPLVVATTVDVQTGANFLVRQDGVQIFGGSGGQDEKVTYSAGCSCARLGNRLAWQFTGFPTIRVNVELGSLEFSVSNMESVMDAAHQTLHVIHHQSGGEAILDWATHRLHVQPMVNGNYYTIDCAFGGLVASSDSTDYCVSPLGRCGEVREDVFKTTEILSQEFLQRYEEHGGKLEDVALHRSPHAPNFPVNSTRSKCNKKKQLSTTVLACHREFSEKCMDMLLTNPTVQRSKDLCRGVVRIDGCNSDSGILFFMNPWLSSVLLQRLKSSINPTYSRLHAGISFCDGTVQEHVVFLQPPSESTGEKQFPVTPMAKSVAQFLLMSSLPRTTQKPKETKVGAVHFLTVGAEVPLMTNNLVELLCKDRLFLCEDEMWSKAMRTLPPAEAAMMGSTVETKHILPLRNYDISEANTTHAVSMLQKPYSMQDAKYNFWRSTGLIITPEPIMRVLKEGTESPVLDVSVPMDKMENSAVASNSLTDSKPPNGERTGTIPFMHTVVQKEMPPQEHHFVPSLSVTPLVLTFGRVMQGYRYALPVTLTNTSTVPCRYRVTFPVEYKTLLCVHYPRHFLAAGLTAKVQVELTGTQPLGVMSVSLNISHEGGSNIVEVTFETVGKEDALSSTLCDTTAVVLGPTLISSFVPGTTKRPPPHIVVSEMTKKGDANAAAGPM